MIAKVYTAFGYTPPRQDVDAALGYCGNRWMLPAGGYLLGNGTRLYSPTTMRFHSPDVLSPFGLGGCNTYTYCGGDPVGYSDPSGCFRLATAIRRVKKFLGFPDKEKRSDVLIGYHGTSAEAARKILKNGVRKDASFFCDRQA